MKRVMAATAVAACLTGAAAYGSVQLAGPDARRAPACAWDQLRNHRAPIGTNQLVHTSDAAVVGTVVSVTPARWNSPDGTRWCPPLHGDVPRLHYRDVTVRVTDRVFDSAALPAKAGRAVTFRVFGDGTPTGAVEWENADGSVVRANEVDGRYAIGGSVLVLLARVDNFPTARGEEVVNQVVGSWLGSWTVDAVTGTAASLQPERTVRLDALLGRLADERGLGRVPKRDVASGLNPLG